MSQHHAWSAKTRNRGKARWVNFYVNPRGRGCGLGAGVTPGIDEGRANGRGASRRQISYANYIYGGIGFGNGRGHVHEIWVMGWP